MRYIEAPSPADGARGPMLFLAGGITGCPDWQRNAAQQMKDLRCEVTVLNPRRPAMPPGDKAHDEQVAWEYAALERATVILFWFCAETVQPIALYELGRHAARGAALAVGAHPQYERRRDVLAQLSHARPDITVLTSLPETTRCAAALLESPPRYPSAVSTSRS